MLSTNRAESFTNEAIIKQMKKICLSVELSNKSMLCRLLNYLVTEKLAGREDKLKGYTIGTEALGREEGYDSDKDPLVRIHAGRLRRLLRLYYHESGKNDELKIEIPKGSYIPNFLPNVAISEKGNNFHFEKQQSIFEPSVAVFPFKNISGDSKKDFFSIGFAEELSIELTKFEDLVVYESIPFSSHEVSDDKIRFHLENNKVRFIIEGSVQLTEEKIKVLVKLVDNSKGKQIWAERYLKELSGNDLNEIQENIISEISSVIGSEYGIILQKLSHENTTEEVENLNVFLAMSKFHYHQTQQTIESAREALASLEQAVELEPNSGKAHAVLASLYGNRYLLDFPGAEEAFEKMNILIEKAIRLSPNSVTVRVIYATVKFMRNDKPGFLEEVEKCLYKTKSPSMRLGALGFYLALSGEWNRGKDILDKVMHANINFPNHYFGATTLFYYRNKNYKEALIEANNYINPALFWAPMLRAATLGQLNRLEEAKLQIEHLVKLRPDFEAKAHYLISLFVKEEELVHHVIEGFQKAGMKVKVP